MQGELKPCPFCGKHPAIAFSHELGRWDIYEIECADCMYSLEGPTGFEGEEARAATVERWNARPPSTDAANRDLARRLSGPHEWGYRDPVEGGFISDNTPFEASNVLASLSSPVEPQGEMREALAKIVARYQGGMGLSAEEAWEDGWGIADAILAALSLTATVETADVAGESREAIRREIINAPETADFMAGVPLEAAHQRERWGVDHDAGKSPFDWFWLIGYLAQKAASASVAGDSEKAMHHTISTAAALANWHASLSGADTRMRPGIAPPTHGTGVQTSRDMGGVA